MAIKNTLRVNCTRALDSANCRAISGRLARYMSIAAGPSAPITASETANRTKPGVVVELIVTLHRLPIGKTLPNDR
ncbi:hypothetical protein PS3A_52210 [Pseudomonas sp. 3A(2025)]